jgi:hypothetical protein
MAYVDLNPIRAGIENSLENSDWTSIQERLIEINKTDFSEKADYDLKNTLKDKLKKQTKLKKELGLNKLPQNKLLDFNSLKNDDLIPFSLLQYIELVQATGQVIREDKTGYIPNTQNPILDKLGIEINSWVEYLQEFNENTTCIGGGEALENYAKNNGKSWVWSGNKVA